MTSIDFICRPPLHAAALAFALGFLVGTVATLYHRIGSIETRHFYRKDIPYIAGIIGLAIVVVIYATIC